LRRKLLILFVAGALAISGAFTGHSALAASGPSGGACQLTGSANLTPPLSGTSGSFSYNFSGTLSSCQSNDGAPSSGTVSAGQSLTQGGATYQEPASTGTGSCTSSTTKGTAIIKWADGDYTVLGYSTAGSGAVVALQGTVVPGVTLTGTQTVTANGTTTTETVHLTISTDEPATPVGDNALGELIFSTPSPTGAAGCAPGGAGVPVASINGLTEIGQD
jgi:hypothetical protein